MITADGWFDWAERAPGPADKTNSGVNTVKLYVPHSAVGFYSGWLSRLFSNERKPDGTYTAYAAASVHGFILYDGRLIQHYPVSKQCWGSGNAYMNNNGIAVENEGGFSPVTEPLTEAQLAANVLILQDLQELRDVGPEYWRRPINSTDLAATLYEHRDGVRFGGLGTSCPSGRIPWAEVLRRLVIEDEREGDGMYIVSKVNTGHEDWYKSYLVRGKEFRHIPDPEHFNAITVLDLPFYEPSVLAWEFMIQGATIVE